MFTEVSPLGPGREGHSLSLWEHANCAQRINGDRAHNDPLPEASNTVVRATSTALPDFPRVRVRSPENWRAKTVFGDPVERLDSTCCREVCGTARLALKEPPKGFTVSAAASVVHSNAQPELQRHIALLEKRILKRKQ